MAKRKPTAEHFECDNETYHSLPGVSNSKLSDFLNYGPELYHGRYIADPPIFPREPASEPMIFGTNCHSVIEAGSVEAVFTVIPRDALNDQGHRKGSAWKQFEAENAGKVLVKDEDLDVYRRILVNVRSHLLAAKILYGPKGHSEFNIRWTDKDSGLLMRSRLDRVDAHEGIIADIKTTKAKNNREISSAIYALGYHRQRVIYGESWQALTSDELDFVFIFVQNAPPYRVLVRDLSESFTELGQQEVRKGLSDLGACMDSGNWTSDQGVDTLDEPGYAKYGYQWE